LILLNGVSITQRYFLVVIGQEAIVKTLQQAVASGKIGHAYLFTGTRGVGKTSVARIMAKAVNCLKPSKDGDACAKCQVCKTVEDGNFLDLIEVDAASNTGVENVRELIEHARFSPSVGKYKVFIIDEVHMLSKGAFNALLKTLEEPPAHVIFILATTEVQKVPATIISRTQRFDFSQIEKQEMVEALKAIAKKESFKLEGEVFELVASRAEGSLRDALSILDKVFTLGESASVDEVRMLLGVSDVRQCSALFDLIVAKDAQGIVEFLDSMQSGGTDFVIYNKDFLEYLRKLLIISLTGKAENFNLTPELLETIKLQSHSLAAGELMRIIRLFLRAYNDLATSPSANLPMLLASIEAFVKPGSAGGGLTQVKPVSSPIVNSGEIKSPSRSQNLNNETISLPEESLIATDAEIELGKIKDHWPEILAEIKKTNSPLATMVKNSTIYGTEGDKLIFEVRFAFDKESLENSKNSQVIKSAIDKACAQKVRIVARIAKKQDNGKTTEPAVALADVLSVFEGELVE
jgi:DNA polymerase-3 subunit gamma/tau